MNAITVGMPKGVTTRKLQQAMAFMVALMMLLSTGAFTAAPAMDLGKKVSIILSKLNPADTRPEKTVERLGGEVGQPIGIVDGFEAKVPEGAVPTLAASPGVRGLTYNSRVRVEGAYGEDSGVASAVYAETSRATRAWRDGYTGKGITVAVIDTGVDIRNDLSYRVIGAADFSGENQPFIDSYGHGTFVAGLIAGSGAGSNGAVKGVAPEANIFSVKIAGRDGTTDIFRLLAALEFVTLHKDAFGIRVLNLSLGSDSTQSYLVDPLNFAVQRVWNSGIVVVAAAGNNGKIVKPADDPLVITVGAVDDKTTHARYDDTMASFSGAGPTLSNRLAKPDVVASGKSVVSSRSIGSTLEANFPNAVIGDRYFKGSGTSFSAAIVSGAAALVIQKQWSLNPNQVKHRLMSTARPLGRVSAMQQGEGPIDAYNAMVSEETTAANQGVRPAGGWGSIQASVGSSCYRNAEGNCMTDAELIAAVGFDQNAFYGSSWAGSSWQGSSWLGSSWQGSQWLGSSWQGSSWQGSSWQGSAWQGSAWQGSSWQGSAWAGSSWQGSSWQGSTWAGIDWAGSSWLGSSWQGSSWQGSSWQGSSWQGSSWLGSTWAGSIWQSDLQWLGSHWS
jgi:serine protease AprX